MMASSNRNTQEEDLENDSLIENEYLWAASQNNEEVGMDEVSIDGRSVLSLDQFSSSQRSKRKRDDGGHQTGMNFTSVLPPMEGSSPWVSTELFPINLATLQYTEPIPLQTIYSVHQYLKDKGVTDELGLVQQLQYKIEQNKTNFVQYHEGTERSPSLRVYPARPSIGQSCSKALRGALACDYEHSTTSDLKFLWRDIDVKNSAPTLIANAFHLNLIPCPVLDWYIQDGREELFKAGTEIGLQKTAVKKLFVALLNGKDIFSHDIAWKNMETWTSRESPPFRVTVDLRDPKERQLNIKRELVINLREVSNRAPNLGDFILSFACEMHNNSRKLYRLMLSANKQFVKKTLKIAPDMTNKFGKFIARYYNFLERCVLTVAISECAASGHLKVYNGLYATSLIHDGFMIYCRDEEITDELLDEIAYKVQTQLNLKVKFVVKEFDTTMVKPILDYVDDMEFNDELFNVSGRTPFDSYGEEDVQIPWERMMTFPNEDAQKQEDFIVTECNRHFAMIEHTKPPSVLCKRWNQPERGKGYCVKFLCKVEDLRTKYGNRKVIMEVNGKPREKCIVDIWYKSVNRLSFETLTFVPSHDGRISNKRAHNMFQGFRIEPRDAREYCEKHKLESESVDEYVRRNIQPWIVLLRDHVCGEGWKYFRNWQAFILQYRQKTKKRIDLFSQKQGCGKGTCMHYLEEIIGRCNYVKVEDMKKIQKFNHILQNKVVCFLDEAFFSGDPSIASALKSMVTEDTLIYRQMYFEPTESSSYLNIVSANNFEQVSISTEVHTRRCMAYECPSIHGGNPTADSDNFFVRQLKHGLDPSIVAQYLYTLDLNNFRPTHSPTTHRLLQQIKMTLNKHQKFIFDMLVSGEVPYYALLFDGVDRDKSGSYEQYVGEGLHATESYLPEPPDWESDGITVLVDGLYIAYKKTTRHPIEFTVFSRKVRQIFNLTGTERRVKVKKVRKQVLELPPLATSRTLFVDFVNGTSRQTTWKDWTTTSPSVVYLGRSDLNDDV